MARDALIIFSRLPVGRETKTRLSPILSEEQRGELHSAMWKDLFPEALKLNGTADVFLYWTGSGDIADYRQIIPESFILREQSGENLGVKMSNAMCEILSSGYGKAVLIGSDIPSLRAGNIQHAFRQLDDVPVVLGPSADGGYWLIGMSEFVPEAFTVKSWGHSDVLTATTKTLNNLGIRYRFADTLQDMDTPEDVREFMLKRPDYHSEVYKFLSLNVPVNRK
ncbi:MAG: TIGR04282 family arsenosugar biosynthesis glycosyltransferase [Synergistaceae bacterium]|nr:TIGR04282 family arsenosugar biosynthesis glycosyltransferase [Synergistaceae bacterium]